MPCSDVTEILNIQLDEQDRLEHYALRKLSCDKVIGAEALLVEPLAGKTPDEILALLPSDLSRKEDQAEADEVSEFETFLLQKHLFALQKTLSAYLGRTSGGRNDICAIAEVCCDGNGTRIEARIEVDLLTEQIRACKPGGCPTGKCDSNRPEKSSP